MKSDPKEKILMRMAEIFFVLSDPTRLKILYSMLERSIQVSEIAEFVGMSVSAVSHQLKLLRDKHLVKTFRQGRKIFYSLNDYHIPALLALAREHSSESNC